MTYSDHSLAQLGVLVGRGIGFDFIHAGGCLLFALAFGPALARSIARFTARLQVTWRPVDGALLPVLALACAAVAAAGLASAPSAPAAGTPAGYLLGAENADGGFGPAPGSASNELYSGWAALGLASAGHSPGALSHGGSSLLSYVREGSPSDAGSLERTILVSAAAGAPARDSAGRDLLAALARATGPGGAVSDQVNLTAFAVLALRGAGAPVRSRTLGWLAAQQNGDGGFSFAAGGAGGSDVDDTGRCWRHWARERPRRHGRCGSFGPRQNSDGGLPRSARREVQRPVDGLGGPGSARRRGGSRRGAPGPQPLAAGLPAWAACCRRACPLFKLQRPDAGVGDCRSTDGTGAPAAAARSGESRAGWLPPHPPHRPSAQGAWPPPGRGRRRVAGAGSPGCRRGGPSRARLCPRGRLLSGRRRTRLRRAR